jgi:hypothetical protein
MLVAPRAGNPDTWAENDGAKPPTIAFAEGNSPDYAPRQKPTSFMVVIDFHHPN